MSAWTDSIMRRFREDYGHESFPLGDAAAVILSARTREPRPYSNDAGTKCHCGAPLLKVGTHCALCHVSFVDEVGFEMHLSEQGCADPSLSARWVMTQWGGWRWNYTKPEGAVGEWMLTNVWGDPRYVADVVHPIASLTNYRTVAD